MHAFKRRKYVANNIEIITSSIEPNGWTVGYTLNCIFKP